MSEYQYYEFRAVDRPLSERELRALNALSTRAEITSTSFTNTYNWGNFKGDPDKLMETYFDAFLYVANWGTHRFVLRLPGKHRFKALSAYSVGDGVHARVAGDYVIVEFQAQEDGGEWEEGEGWMASLIPLRAELLREDHRSLYLRWLRSVQNGDLDDDDHEPPVPSGLRNLTRPLQAIVDFLGIDNELVEVAAKVSGEEEPGPTRDDLAAWIRQLPESEKDALLLNVALSNTINLQAELFRRYTYRRPAPKAARASKPARRTVGQLLATARELEEQSSRLAAERKAAEKAKQAQQEMERRADYLDQLAKRQQTVWHQVAELIRTKRPNDYARAVNLLIDLREVAVRRGKEMVFETAIRHLRETNASKPSFLRRLGEAKL